MLPACLSGCCSDQPGIGPPHASVNLQAVRHYDRAIELDPQNKEAMCNKAAALLKLKQWPEAAAVAEQVRGGVQSPRMLGRGSEEQL